MIRDCNVHKAMIFPLSSFIILLCALSSVPLGDAIWLNLPTTGPKCISEEIHKNVVVLADYIVLSVHDGQISAIAVKVVSPYAKVLHHKENVTYGRFAFTTVEAGNYLACFWADNRTHHGTGDVVVNIDWRTGIAAKDWESVARKEKLQGVELELKKLEGAVESIYENLLYLKNREADMRSMSDDTNAKVAWFSIMSLAICILASGLQSWHLKRFFQKKKLI